MTCDLREGDIDPLGGGTVKLIPDHKDAPTRYTRKLIHGIRPSGNLYAEDTK